MTGKVVELAPRDRTIPTASIIINNYNYARFLQDAIDSALAQTWPQKEVIVVDDGSTDNSREVIESYAGRITAIYKPNGGQASAINAGFAQCHGDFVIFLDSDDILRAMAVAKVAEVWSSNVARVQFCLELIDETGRLTGRAPTLIPMSTAKIRSMLLQGYVMNGSPTSGNAFSRDALEKLLPIPVEQWRISADTYLLLLTPFAGEVVSLPERLGGIRQHPTKNALAARFSVEDARRWIIHDRNAFEVLGELVKRRGDGLSDDWLLTSPGHIGARLASLRLGPKEHPFSHDRWLPLLLAGFRACRTHPLHSKLAQLMYAAWLTALALAPGRLVPAIAEIKLRMLRSGRTARLRRYPRRSARRQPA